VAPEGEWTGWVLKAGRGAGKTRTGAQDVAEHLVDNAKYRYAIVAQTIGEARDVCIEGESGVRVQLEGMGFRDGEDFEWNRSLGELLMGNGSIAKTYSAEKPAKLRGPQHHRAWLDELASWKDAHRGDALDTTYNNLMLTLRLGEDPRYIVTTTPKQVKLFQELMADPDVAVSNGTTYDNLANLSPTFRAHVLRYEGTTIGRQELMGELLDEVEGAHWHQRLIEENRLREPPPLARVHLGVDPSGGADIIGIVAVGETWACTCGDDSVLPHYVVIDDLSLLAEPEAWAAAVGGLYRRHQADLIAAEANYGGAMVEAVIRQADKTLPVHLVTASRGKHIRAEPIAFLMQKGRMHHAGAYVDLETEMTTYTPEESGKWSPNRLDAMVWATTSLLDKRLKNWSVY
jgi:phage terminase large subunit-like protein